MKKLFHRSKKYYEENPDWDDMEYTDEETEFAEDAYYEDEDGVYEAEEAYEDEDGVCEAEEAYEDEDGICEAEESYEDEDDLVYEDEFDEEDETVPWSAMPDRNVFQRLWNSLLHMSTMDKVVATTGVLVLVLALVTGAFFVSANMMNKQVSSLDAVGSQLSGISVIGEQGLLAVADAELARVQAANAIEEEETNKEYEESEYSKEVEVAVNMTSIEKDLKVKFVNNKTNKLISNVPFSVTVKNPDGETEVWTDEDMDGIIYKSKITPGNYSVTLNTFEDEKYGDYILPESAKKVTVKKEIAYEKVEVSDEIKDESEIDAKEEDTKENETTIESTLTDTVNWVDSSKTVLDAVYTAVDKKNIADPLAAAKSTMFMRTAEVTMNSLTLTLETGKTITGSVAVAVPEGVTFKEGTVSYTSSDAAVATVDAAGTVTALSAGTTTITFSATGVKTVTTPDVSDGGSSTVEEPYTGTCTVTVNPAAPTTVAVTGITLNKTTLSLEKGVSETLTATVVPETATDKSVKWTSSDAAIVSVEETTGKLTAVKEGNATITAASVSNPEITATCAVTVTAPAGTKTLTLDKTTLAAFVGTKTTIKATVSNSVNGGDITGTITATVDKTEIAEAAVGATDKGETTITITPKAKGTAILTVKLDNTLTAICTITVGDLTMTLDKATASVLTDAKTELTVVIGSTAGEVKVESTNAGIAKAEVTTTKSDTQITAKVTVTGVQEGSATITISYTENGVTTKKTCTVTVKKKETRLVDAQKQQLYVLQSDGTYREATYADYYDKNITTFYTRKEGVVKYTGWQTIDGKLYFFDASGKKITGEQVIQGAKYNFASDGSLVVGGGTFGIDVSKWNGTIDWTSVKNSGVNYVIIRCGYRGSSTGALVVDPKFEKNIKGATAAGIKVGVYFFSQAVNKNEAVEEASMVLELIKKYTISYPVFLDVEASGGRADSINKTTRTEVIKAFCETIQNSGYTAGLYANKSWLTNKIDTSQLTKYKIWLAQYASAPTYTGRYDMWQYKSTGKVSGISGNVDLNISYLGY